MKVLTVAGEVTLTMTEDEAAELRCLQRVLSRAWVDSEAQRGFNVLSEMIQMLREEGT